MVLYFRTVSRPVVKLAKSTLNQTNIPPKETVVYSKETQTPVVQHSTESGNPGDIVTVRQSASFSINYSEKNIS